LTAYLRLTLVPFLLLAGASAARAQSTLEVMPGLGFGKATGNDSDEVDAGPGLFLSVGARLNPRASLRGQLSLDKPEDDSDIPGLKASFWLWRAQLVPAVHVGNERLDFAVGPALGLVYMRASIEGNTPFGRIEGHVTTRGFTLGGQAWLMARVSPGLSLGPVFSYGRLWATKSCSEASGQGEVCDDDPDNDDAGYWNLSLGLLF
jgi:hypothetical protein